MMQIHRVRGRDLREALEKARTTYGSDALVLNHEVLPGGGVTVAVTDASRQEAVARPAAEPVAAPARGAGHADIERYLERTGTSSSLTRQVLAAVARSGETGPFAIDAAARELASLVRIAPSPKVPRPAGAAARSLCALAFVGPTGVGKTTTLAKLASKLVRAGRRVGLATGDARRPGAVEQLGRYAKLLQVPLDVVRGPEDLDELVTRAKALDVLLLDTGGSSARDVPAVHAAGRALTSGHPRAALFTYLVVPATATRAALDLAGESFADAGPSAAIVTKLDETRAPAPVLEHVIDRALPIAFLCDGPDVASHLRRPSPDDVADLFLRGRLA